MTSKIPQVGIFKDASTSNLCLFYPKSMDYTSGDNLKNCFNGGKKNDAEVSLSIINYKRRVDGIFSPAEKGCRTGKNFSKNRWPESISI